MEVLVGQMTRLSPSEAMALAITEGKRGAGFVSPNPLVGCVILDRNFEFLSSGFHARLGDLHAEASALQQISDRSRLEGAHIFVTLEPCAHEGRQPSCAKTLAALPIASVTYGLKDPNPKVSGQGETILLEAGKKVVEFPLMQTELEELAEIFLLNMKLKRPFVSVKIASSMDGQVALKDGTSQWITGETARDSVQGLRGVYDAVLTGVGTFLKDDPRLNSRDPRYKDRPQRVVLLDPEGLSLSRLATSNLLKVRSLKDIWLVTKPGLSAPDGVHHLTLPLQETGEFQISDLLHELQRHDIHSLFVEAGGQTAAGFFNQKLVDRLYLYLAPKLLGNGLSWTSKLNVESLDLAIELGQARVESMGKDLLLHARPVFRS